MLYLKQCDLVEPPYHNVKISYLSDSEDYVQYIHNLINAKHKVYHSMAKNEQDAKVKNPSQLYER